MKFLIVLRTKQNLGICMVVVGYSKNWIPRQIIRDRTTCPLFKKNKSPLHGRHFYIPKIPSHNKNPKGICCKKCLSWSRLLRDHLLKFQNCPWEFMFLTCSLSSPTRHWLIQLYGCMASLVFRLFSLLDLCRSWRHSAWPPGLLNADSVLRVALEALQISYL
jgi:hypothetical protein